MEEKRYDVIESNYKNMMNSVANVWIACGVSFILTFIVAKTTLMVWLSLTLFFISLVLLIAPFIMWLMKSDDISDQIDEYAKSKVNELGYNINDFIFKRDNSKVIGLSVENEKVIFLTKVTDKFDYAVKEIPFEKILDVSVSDNNSTLTSVSKGGVVGGALVGGFLLGGFGSVIGAMSANKKSSEMVHNLNLNITVDDLYDPLIRFEILENVNGINKQSETYNSTIKILDEWFSKFTIILKRNEKLNNII